MAEEESMWKYFPLKTVEDVQALEEKLKSTEFFQSCVAHLSASAEKSSESRTVTWAMAKIMALDLAMMYTWKGQTRKDHRVEKKPFHNLAVNQVLMAVMKRCWPGYDRSRVETVASAWLAQAKAKYERLTKKNPGQFEAEQPDEDP